MMRSVERLVVVVVSPILDVGVVEKESLSSSMVSLLNTNWNRLCGKGGGSW